MNRGRWAAGGILFIGAVLAGCGNSEDASWGLKAETVLPPGQSGFFSSAGQAAGSASGDPADYGPHVDDQRLLYWSFDTKSGVLGRKPGTPEVPKDGVRIYRDEYGVPIVYAATARDLWFGVGYAIAQDRLFLMDAVRRTGAGTLAELTGCGTVPADIQQRVLGFSDAEFQRMFEALTPASRDMILGYLDGANAWREEAIADPDNKLPAEYELLTSLPAEFTVRDVLAGGVYITRFVAAEGGNEFLNLRMLRELEAAYGSRSEALKAFQDMVWLEDDKAVTSVPRSEGTFSNHPWPPGGRDAAFAAMAAWALDDSKVPETVWKGAGTGHAPRPDDCEAQSGNPFPLLTGGSGAGGPAAAEKTAPEAKQARFAALSEGLDVLRRKPTGASFALAVGRERSYSGGTLLISAPQLGYSYPLLLAEFEIHGAGYHARGVSVPGLPTVGIGYTPHIAWALTTGYSKTIDSYIERICSTDEIAGGACAANQYFHKGVWKNMECRTETVAYRPSSQGVPFGSPDLSTDIEVCRTVHGPVVARDDAAGRARSVQYAMFGREVETIEGIREWNTARSFAEFLMGVSKVTWNENVVVATRDGHIGFFHPGLHRRRNAATDQRLPIPGTGEYDAGDWLPFSETPQVIDPQQGFVANWNNKPAFGWLDGEGMGSTSRPGGPGQRVTNLIETLEGQADWKFSDLREIDRTAGTRDPRAREYRLVIAAFHSSAAGALGDVEKAALDRLLAWDRSHYGPGIDIEDETATDGPAATIFGYYVEALRDELFGELKDRVIDPDEGLTVYGRVAGVGSHVFDHSVMDNLVLRVLSPSSSSLALRRDYTGGRSRNAVMHAALNTALQRLADDFNGGAPLSVGDLDKCRRIHPRSQICSLTGVIGPGSDTAPGGSCVTMPYQDRGSWVHRVGYEPGR